MVNDAFDKALAEAEKMVKSKWHSCIECRNRNSTSIITVNLPKEVQDTIIAKRIVSTVVVVDNPNIQIDMDLEAVGEINSHKFRCKCYSCPHRQH